MRFMVIETFRAGKDAVYERLSKKGRMLPEGLKYIDSWIECEGSRCFQLMETEPPELFETWTANSRSVPPHFTVKAACASYSGPSP